MTIWKQVGFAILAIFFCISTYAALVQNAQDIRSTVERYLQTTVASTAKPDEEVKITVGSLDAKLQIHACQQQLEAFLPSGLPQAEITTVGVRCSDKLPWTVYVPVNVKILSSVLVATRSISKGEVIQEQDLDLAKRDKNQLRGGFFTDKSMAVGQVASQGISSGTPLSQRLIEMPNIIIKGQPVMLFVRINKVYVEVKGIAKEDGYLNKMIPVLNNSTNKIVQGRVAGPGKVDVGG